jgi:hypothetical protein
VNVFGMVRDFILADPALALVLGTRVYPLKVPQTAIFPALTLTRVSGESGPPLRGGRASLSRPRYQFDVWTKEGQGSAFEVSQQIGELLRERLEGATVDLLDTSVLPPAWRRFAFELALDRDEFDEGEGATSGFYRYSADYLIWHQTGQGPA